MPHVPEDELEKGIALVVGGTALVIIILRRIREFVSRVPPDPWPQETDLAVRARDAIPVCTNCLYPQEGHQWFCPHCAFPVGEYVMIMPYLPIFATGEVLRRGVSGPPEKGWARNVFLFFYATSEYTVFAPIYWFWMARKAGGKPICQVRREELKFEEEERGDTP